MDPWTSHLSHRLHPFTTTWVCGYSLHSPSIPRKLSLLQKGDRVWLRDHSTCSSEKGMSVLLETHQIPKQYLFRWRSLVGYSPWGHKELDMIEHAHICQPIMEHLSSTK